MAGTTRPKVVFNRLPLVGGVANGEFKQLYSIQGKGTYEHGGMDMVVLNGPTLGAKLVNPSTANSRVHSLNWFGANGAYGLHVILDHPGTDQWSLLAHMSEIQCEKDDVLPPAGAVGLAGATGFVTGAHTHWEVADDPNAPSFGAIRQPDAAGIGRLVSPTLRNPRDYMSIVNGPTPQTPAPPTLEDIAASLARTSTVVVAQGQSIATISDRVIGMDGKLDAILTWIAGAPKG